MTLYNNYVTVGANWSWDTIGGLVNDWLLSIKYRSTITLLKENKIDNVVYNGLIHLLHGMQEVGLLLCILCTTEKFV